MGNNNLDNDKSELMVELDSMGNKVNAWFRAFADVLPLLLCPEYGNQIKD